MLSLSLGDTNIFFKVWPPLKCTSTPCFLQMCPVSMAAQCDIWQEICYGGCFFFFCWCFLKIFLIAHVGYLHCTSTFSRCCSSCSANSGEYSVINTLSHRALTISSTPELAEQELQHLEKVLVQCKYPTWAIKKIFRKHQQKKKKHPPVTDFLPYVTLCCHTHRA